MASPGDAANGGGWYTLGGSGRVNFGFNVHKDKVKHSDTFTYSGQVLLINNGKWRLKGSLDDYVSSPTTGQGAATGTGDLYWWNAALNDGLGDWQLARSNVSFTISFEATSGGKGQGQGQGKGQGKGKGNDPPVDTTWDPGAFGIHIDYTPVSGQPGTLPNSGLTDLKGGQINVS